MSFRDTPVGFMPHYARKGRNVPLRCLLDGVRTGTWSAQIGKMRAAGKGSPDFDRIKKALPSFMLSATTTNGKHGRADVGNHTGLLQIDVDGVGAGEVEALRDRLGKDRHIVAAWVSPSGTGVKAIMLIPDGVERHGASFAAAAAYLMTAYGVESDKACKDLCRLCYVSSDARLVLNEGAVPLPVPELAVIAMAPTPAKGKKGAAKLADFDPCSTSQAFGQAGGGEEEEREENSTATATATGTTLSERSAASKKPIHFGKAFSDFAELVKLYEKLVARNYRNPQRGNRNAMVMTGLVPFLSSAVAPLFVEAFAEEFYRQHGDVFSDYPLATYQAEVRSVAAGCEASFRRNLSDGVRFVYETLDDDEHRTAFRICHSLSLCERDASAPPQSFFLSTENLALRLGSFGRRAWRILQRLEWLKIIETVSAGTMRAKGQRGVATVFRWLPRTVSTPPTTTNPTPPP